MSRHVSFSERRRASLRKQVDRLELLEIRNTITEPISVLGLSLSAYSGLNRLGIADLRAMSSGLSGLTPAAQAIARGGQQTGNAAAPPTNFVPIAITPWTGRHAAAGGGAGSEQDGPVQAPQARVESGDAAATNTPAAASDGDQTGISSPWRPVSQPGGGAAMPPRGGSGGLTPTKAAIRAAGPSASLPASTPAASGAGGSAALLAAAAGSAGGGAAAGAGSMPRLAPPGSLKHGGAGGGGIHGGTGASSGGSGTVALVSSGPTVGPGSIPDPTLGNGSGPSQETFTYFPLYVLDVNNGVVLFPGVDQQATLRASVILQAQVSGTTVSTYNWNTSGISSDATSIAGASTYQLSFRWTNETTSAHVDPVTLSVTDTNSHIETYTYDFALPLGSVSNSGGGGNATWPASLSPDTVSPADPAWASDGVSVDSNSGSLDTAIPLPSYNPNVPALALTYDSVSANPMPIIVAENTLSASAAVPSQVGATLTFNNTVGTTYYYSISSFNPGDVQQIALQATGASSLATGRYAYSMQIVDYGTTNTTITLSGTATLLNESGSAFGDGWVLDGLEKITSASGGVILDLGGGGSSLWFAGSFGSGGGTYTDPPGEFSTLVKNSNGSYTDTLTDGTQINFNSGGYEVATVDLNTQHITYTYNGSNQLASITDNYSNITSFTYSSGGHIQSIEDPSGRFATFTSSGSSLVAVEQADGSVTSYTYDSSGRMTQVEDPMTNVVSITYDSSERVGTITRPDLSTEEFSAFQEQGWTNTGTSGSPAAAMLFAAAAASHTDPNGNVTTLRPDWYGLGMTGVGVDALGDVVTNDINSNGLPTVTIDQVNRISQFTYDSKGNITEELYPDLNTIKATYNSDAEPLTATNENGGVTSFTYDGDGNNTVIEDPVLALTTITYTSTGRIQSVTDANNHTTSYQYDSQDRLATLINADGTTEKFGYNSQGNVISATDERSNTTTFSLDALNRLTGSTNPLGGVATYTYDADGDLTKDQEPTPAGQTARTTNYTYNSINELTVATDPLGLATSYAYDRAGNQVSVTDPMGRITTTVFDQLNRPYVEIDPMGNHLTTTYDGDSEPTQVVDALGRITTATYSNRGWVPTVTDPLANVTTYSYTATGQTLSTTEKGASGGAQPYVYGYNADDELTSVTDPLSKITSYSYDPAGNLISAADPDNNITTYAYDSTNELTTITDPLGDTTVYSYDAAGNRQTTTDGLGHTSSVLYDALNRPTTLTSAVGGISTITYDSAGRETSLTDPVGNKTQWAYDADDRVTTVTEPNNHTVTYFYDSDGEVTDMTDAAGRRTTFSYNADGDETGETWVGASPSEKITYTYDADNEMTGAADGFATLTFTFNSGGEVQTAATSGPGTGQPSALLSYTYDPGGNEISLTDNLSSAGITTTTYDADERVSQVAASYGGTAGPQVNYNYDPASRMTSELRTIGGSGDSVNTSFGYDAAGRQTTITHQVFIPSGSGGSTTALATYVYGYDKADRVTTQVNADGTYTYTYDNADELTGVDKNGTQTESYSYDLNGNRTETGFSTTVMNETATSPGVTFTYDGAGNMITAQSSSSTATYTYDFRNRLTEVTQGGTVIASYIYDALNRRIGIDDNSTQTWSVYDGTNPYADFNGSGTMQERYVSGPGVVNGAVVDELLARTSSGGTTAWYLDDQLGSVRDIVSTSGGELDHIVYDSFGNILTQTNASNGDRFTFAGMEYDSTTGQYYDRARDFDPATGKFMSIDPKSFAAHDTNLYRYVGDSPLNSTDPSGMQQPNLPTDNPIARKALAELNLATVQKSLKAERDKQAAREKTIVTFAGGEEAAAKLIVQYERDIAALFKRNVDLGQIVIGAEVNLGIMDALKKAHVRGEMARFAYIELKGIRARIDSLEIDEAYQIQLVHYYDILAFNAAHPGINVPAIVPRRDQNAPANPPNQPGRRR